MPKIITIKSATVLDGPKKIEIGRILEARYGRDVSYDFIIDESIVGGILIIDGERVYDATYYTALSKLKASLKSAGGVDLENLRKRTKDLESGLNSIDELLKNRAVGDREPDGSRDGVNSDEGLSAFESKSFKERIKNYVRDYGVVEGGKIKSISDGVIKVSGLNSCKYGELLKLGDEKYAIAMNLEEDSVGAVLLCNPDEVNVDDIVYSTGNVVEVPTGEALLGRVVNPLGIPIDGSGDVITSKRRRVEFPAPKIIDRGSVEEPLETGILAIDSMIPIGKGQRELIIGDRQTGKTAVALDIILNQRDKNVYCVYVAIGQKASSIAKIVKDLKDHEALPYTIVVCADAKDPAPLQYIAPFSGCAMAEEFMYGGRDVLIVYDDLSKHAVAYRTLSLLLRRPSGREAYPGDIFYLHSRLLERAAKLSLEKGGGSMTALPIIETLAGDISAYIPTNVISITDGQIFLESQLFNSGIRPAVNVGLSVSRVGGAAQGKAMRQVSGKLRLDLAHYRELEVFSQFGSDLDQTTRDVLEHGKRTTEALKQQQYVHMSVDKQIVSLYVVINGRLKGVEVDCVPKFLEGFFKYAETVCPAALTKLRATNRLTGDVTDALDAAAGQYADYYNSGAIK